VDALGLRLFVYRHFVETGSAPTRGGRVKCEWLPFASAGYSFVTLAGAYGL
jgi:hypothetical protein